MATHDPMEPTQRKQLGSLVPGLLESKLDVYAATQEQRAFLNNMSMKLDCSRQEWFRILLILGGGEKLLEHPMDQVFGSLGRTTGGGNLASDAQRLITAFDSVPGLFSFATDKRDARSNPQGFNRNRSLAQREKLAALMLHHFPRLLTGAYNTIGPQTSTIPQEKRTDAAEKLVEMCEEFVDRNVPLGDIANEYVTPQQIGARADRVGRDLFRTAFTQ